MENNLKYIYINITEFAVYLKLTQYWKSTILQQNFFLNLKQNKKQSKHTHTHTHTHKTQMNQVESFCTRSPRHSSSEHGSYAGCGLLPYSLNLVNHLVWIIIPPKYIWPVSLLFIAMTIGIVVNYWSLLSEWPGFKYCLCHLMA